MDKFTIIDNEYHLSWCDPSKRMVGHKWRTHCGGEIFRDIMIKNTEVFEKHYCTKWLSDDRNFGPLLPADKEWGIKHWSPRILKAGWKSHAMILPKEAMSQIVLRNMLDWYEDRGVQAGIFSTPEEAMTWLEKI